MHPSHGQSQVAYNGSQPAKGSSPGDAGYDAELFPRFRDAVQASSEAVMSPGYGTHFLLTASDDADDSDDLIILS